jgi:cytochrome b
MQGEPQPSATDEPGSSAAPRPASAPNGWRPVLVWDLPIRLSHWLAVALVIAAYLTWQLNRMDWHAWVGDALLTLVLFRLLWGLFGSETARFSRFVKSPRAALRHLAHISRREPDLQAGHNPAGGWMIMILLVLLLGQALTGLYVDNDVANEGPLTELLPARIADLITALHDTLLWNALLAAITVHVLGILVYGVVKRHNLLAPMITGRKILPNTVPAPRITGPARALAWLICAAAAAVALANYL